MNMIKAPVASVAGESPDQLNYHSKNIQQTAKAKHFDGYCFPLIEALL